MKSEMWGVSSAVCLAFSFDRTIDKDQVLTMAGRVESAIARHGELRLLLDLRKTVTFEVGAMLSPCGFMTSLRSIGVVSRYAVVAAPAIAATAVELFGAVLPLKARAFSAADIVEARS